MLHSVVLIGASSYSERLGSASLSTRTGDGAGGSGAYSDIPSIPESLDIRMMAKSYVRISNSRHQPAG